MELVERVEALEGDVDELKPRIEALEEKVEKLDARVRRVEILMWVLVVLIVPQALAFYIRLFSP